jgi:F420-non-reducing hydrogenase iron-sulfur subunit
VASDRLKESGFEPEVVMLYCQHCVSEDASVALEAALACGFSVQAVMMPCSSKVEIPYLLRILERGADAVEVVACPSKACRFLVGSSRAEKRIEYVRRLLDEVHVGAERVGISHGSGLSAEELIGLAAYRAQAVRALGPSAMKAGPAAGT